MKHFTLHELGATDVKDFHQGFLDKLVELRIQVGMRFFVNSCARSEQHNEEIGGAIKSLHIFDKPKRANQTGCAAIDIRTTSRAFKVELVKTALLTGWSVGIYKTFTHLDRRIDLGEQQTIFKGK